MAEEAYGGSVSSHWMDLGLETELRIQVDELLCDHAYLSLVVQDKKRRFTRMEMLGSIYHQLFFNANSLGLKLTTSPSFQLFS